eukprot:7562793-Alexandrium_andersonii.AAC.1
MKHYLQRWAVLKWRTGVAPSGPRPSMVRAALAALKLRHVARDVRKALTADEMVWAQGCLLYTSPSPRD